MVICRCLGPRPMQGGGREQANPPARANAVAGRDRRVAHVEATWSCALDIQKGMSGARHCAGISSALSPAPKLFFPPRTFRQIADLALYSTRLVCAFTGRRETFLDILVLDFTVTLHSLFWNEESRAGGSYNSSCYSSYNCHCVQ